MCCSNHKGPLAKTSIVVVRYVLFLLPLAKVTWMRVVDYKSSTVCDGDAKIINCPRNQLIHVLQSFYGKWSNHDCHGALAVRDNIPTCKVDREKSTAIIRDICQGQNSCNLYADDTIYGDPCPSIKKYLYVTYFCMARGGHPHTAPPEIAPLTHSPTLPALIGKSLGNKEISIDANPTAKIPVPAPAMSQTQLQASSGAIENQTHPIPDEKAVMMNSVSRHNIQKSDSLDTTDNSEDVSDVIDELQNAPQILNAPLFRVISVALETLSSARASILSATVCNGQRRTISCIPSEKIKIQYAFYGKKNGHDCHGLLPYKDESPTCSALDAKFNVQSRCNNKVACLLSADENIYGRSLCPNVNKYLHVTYTCQENPLLSSERSKLTPSEDYEEDAVSRSKIKLLPGVPTTIKICNGMRKNIQCPAHQMINILSAFYGKRNGEECRGKLSYKDNVPTCRQRSALDSVRFLCHGHQACNLASQSALFGDDPCPGVNKYLEVVYSC